MRAENKGDVRPPQPKLSVLFTVGMMLSCGGQAFMLEKTFLQENVVKLPVFLCSSLLCSIDCTETEFFSSSSLNNPLHFSDRFTTLWAAPELLSSLPKRLQAGDGHEVRGSRQDTTEIFFLHDVPMAFGFLPLFSPLHCCHQLLCPKEAFYGFPPGLPLSCPEVSAGHPSP